jgi:transcriptional regulator with XRE-family HTH domain
VPGLSQSPQELSQRLRRLRQQWPDVRLTQEALAKALGGKEPLTPGTVSSWESSSSPKLPPRDRLIAYAQFFATRRSVEVGAEPQLVPVDSFTGEEMAAYRELEAELLALRDDVTDPSSGEKTAVRGSWQFPDSGPATLVCAQLPDTETGSLVDPNDPNYTELQSLADLDALFELHGHIRAENPMMDVFYKAAPNVVPDDLSGHVILLGGIAWNEITERLSAMTGLPVKQVRDPSLTSGDPFVVEVDGKEDRFMPVWSGPKDTNLIEDVGLIARVPSPVNSNLTLTICNGIHSRGVLGAVRSLTDKRLRDSNERYISAAFGKSHSFLILMKVTVMKGQTMTPDFNNPNQVLYRWSKGADR